MDHDFTVWFSKSFGLFYLIALSIVIVAYAFWLGELVTKGPAFLVAPMMARTITSNIEELIPRTPNRMVAQINNGSGQ